jgi:nucleotide-binding universal stress UspA family protein
MKNILVPYDFSKTAKNAFDFAVQLAGKSKATITVLHVIDHPTPATLKTMGVSNVDPMEVIYLKKLIEKSESKLEALISGVKAKVKWKIKLGKPFRLITDEIVDSKADVIVMGTRGAEGLNEFFVGSNAERVVRNASCPVITLNKPAGINAIKDVVFASDFQNVNKAFVDKLVDLQKTLDATMHIVKINTPASFTSTRHDNKQMEDFIRKFKIKKFTIDIYNHSNTEDGIIAYAEDIQAHLICLGTTQTKGFGHFIKGSIAEDVVNHAKVPVWTCKV